jgi:hypothetical protein
LKKGAGVVRALWVAFAIVVVVVVAAAILIGYWSR